MKILLFGGSGQLGYELRTRSAQLSFELISPVTAEVDITDREQVTFLTTAVQPDVVINSAAYTAVDKAEEEQARAFAVNRDGACNVALACQAAQCRLIHLSTDYVFDGSLGRPLREDDPVNPLSVYGRSKLEGELAIQEVLGDKALIARTQSLYGLKGTNFVHTMLKLFREREVLTIVNDQWVSPTWAGWLAEVLLDLVRIPCGGVVHTSCAGVTSWFDFASQILRRVQECAAQQGDTRALARLEPITAEKFNRPARRPTYSAFDTGKLSKLIGRAPISWQAGLQHFLSEVGVVSGENAGR